MVGGAILVKAVGSSVAVVDLQKIKNFFINVPDKALELKKGLNSFLATAKSGVHFTKEALTEIKALLHEVDLQSSFKQIVQGATAKVKNNLKAYVVAANMEYEIASLRYLDALNSQRLLLTPSTIIVDNTLGYKKIGALEDVYITVNNNVRKANVGLYVKGEKTVISLEKNLKSEIDEIDTFFNTSLSTEVKHLLNQWDDDLLKNLHKDLLSKTTGAELKKLLQTEDDFLKWKLLKEDPAYAFELSKENSSWTKWGKSNFFKTYTQLGRQFESLVSSKIRNIPPFSTLYKDYTHLKQIYLKGVKNNIIADDLFVKELRDERGRSYFRAIISDSKLKATSPWTANQKSELIDVFKNNPNKKYIEFEVRSDKKYLGNLATDIDFNQNRKVRIYREDVYKIISEGENIKIPPIKMNDVNFK